ncbi:hypothetical protein F4677DRAFT_426584 [Hypoxylon crocopeplum]|nr:hypothetical protein F4677DRAFT_426584 [Hypoxylon crocopeplum]
MKLQSFLLPALVGIATASTEEQLQHAEAYIIRQSKTTTNPPLIPNDLAQAILFQRLSTLDQPSALGQLPESIPQDESISYINQFGKPPRPLFDEAGDANEPNQLVIAFSGVTTEKYKSIKAALSRVPLSFVAPGLSQLPIGSKKLGCAFEHSIDPSNGKCWKGKTQYLEFDATKDSNVITKLGRTLQSLNTQAVDGKLETTILLFGPSTPESEELRRREVENLQQEQVIADDAEATQIPTADSAFNPNLDVSDKPFHAFSAASAPKGILPSCFTSHNACVSATGSCSGHGQCVDKWASIGSDDNSCFYCRCMLTNETDADGRTGVYHWGGSACHKRDISTPFWLFAGVTITLVATVAFSIGLLFSVGEEKLPGVIGAGVSRSK